MKIMQAIYHTSLDKLDTAFIEAIKKQFRNAKVDIVVREMDDTDYLNASPANKAHLEAGIREVEQMSAINSMNPINLINKTAQELDL